MITLACVVNMSQSTFCVLDHHIFTYLGDE